MRGGVGAEVRAGFHSGRWRWAGVGARLGRRGRGEREGRIDTRRMREMGIAGMK